ncbi:MAG: hypothetical protein ABEI80_05675 [Haloplanus sp.]
MQNRTRADWIGTDPDPEPLDLDRYTRYEDGDETVFCDRTNARAWIRADTLVTLDP